jgi:uncharacterized membrane-anchored protein
MSAVELSGVARLGRRTKELTPRLTPADIAVIDHTDLDRVSAEELVESGVRAVVNVARSQSGRYPNPGPLLLVRGGVRLIDVPGAALFDELADGDRITIRGASVFRKDACLVTGRVLDERELARSLVEQQGRVTDALRDFADNTLRYLREEGELLTAGLEFPQLATSFRGRHALVVARGPGHKRDLRIVRPYVRDFKPVLIGVDGGADALLDIGFTPDIIIGDFDSLSDGAVRCGAELLHHVHPDGRAPGRENLEAMGFTPGKEYREFVAEGMSEDVAMLLAYEAGASLIVAVGTHSTMVEMLDKGRRGMSSTFLTRLRLGPVLVDAKGVHRLYEGRVRRRDILVLVLAALLTIIVIGLVAQPIHTYVDGIRLTLDDLWYSITH